MDKLKSMKSLSAYLKNKGHKNLIETMKQQIHCAKNDEDIKLIENLYKELVKDGQNRVR